MADDLELTITILAVDEASAVLREVAQQITADFAAASSDAVAFGAEFEVAVVSAGAAFADLAQQAAFVGAAAQQAELDIAGLEESLIALEQEAANALAILQAVSAASAGLGATSGLGFGDFSGFSLVDLPGGAGGSSAPGGLTGFGNPAPLFGPSADAGSSGGGLLSVSQQQLDVMNQLLDATRQGGGATPIVQNNTFNGILDPSAIRDQVIPLLERAVAQGATLIGNSQ